MFHLVPKSPNTTLKRLWIHAGELIASKNPNRWPKYAGHIKLRHVRSFKPNPSKSVRVFDYHGIEIGRICRSPNGTKSSLSPFWDAVRMAAEAHARMQNYAANAATNKRYSENRVIKLTGTEISILESHPEHQAMLKKWRKIGLNLTLEPAGNDLFKVTHLA